MTAAETIRAALLDLLADASASFGASVGDDDGLSADDLPRINVTNASQTPSDGDAPFGRREWLVRVELHVLATAEADVDAIHSAAHVEIMASAVLPDLCWHIDSKGFEPPEVFAGDFTYVRRIAPYEFKTILPEGQI